MLRPRPSSEYRFISVATARMALDFRVDEAGDVPADFTAS